MSDFSTTLLRVREYGEILLENSRDMLRAMIHDACEAVSAAEGSILVPTDCLEELRFLVSANPALDQSHITFRCDGSVSGYVFSSRQAIAKIKPKNTEVDRVGDISLVETDFLLAVPIADDDQIYGVATFVNRTPDKPETPFSARDLEAAQMFGEIYAAGLKLYRQVALSVDIALADAGETASEFGLETAPDFSLGGSVALGDKIPAMLADRAARLPQAAKEILLDFASLLESHAHKLEATEDTSSR